MDYFAIWISCLRGADDDNEVKNVATIVRQTYTPTHAHKRTHMAYIQ